MWIDLVGFFTPLMRRASLTCFDTLALSLEELELSEPEWLSLAESLDEFSLVLELLDSEERLDFDLFFEAERDEEDSELADEDEAEEEDSSELSESLSSEALDSSLSSSSAMFSSSAVHL